MTGTTNVPLLDETLALQSILISEATGGSENDGRYKELRRALLESHAKALVPAFVRANRTLAQFWQFIKHQSGTYKERREFIYASFQPLLDYLEGQPAPSDHAVAAVLVTVDAEGVVAAWNKALARRTTDPDGAITSSRTLLEAVCKHILDSENVAYTARDDLNKLYNLTCERLKLAPSQHSEDVFKRILGGCTSVVEGLGALRNRLGDAHGQGRAPVRPAPRHAGLAVNLAGSMAMFLMETWKKAP